jgi:hypothetical protein
MVRALASHLAVLLALAATGLCAEQRRAFREAVAEAEATSSENHGSAVTSWARLGESPMPWAVSPIDRAQMQLGLEAALEERGLGQPAHRAALAARADALRTPGGSLPLAAEAAHRAVRLDVQYAADPDQLTEDLWNQSQDDEALQAPEQTLGDDDLALAEVLRRQGDLTEAEAQYRLAQQRWKEAGSPQLYLASLGLARVEFTRGRLREAEALFREARAQMQQGPLNQRPRLAEATREAAEVQELLHGPEAALALLRQTLAQAQGSTGPEHSEVGRLQLTLARFLRKHGELPEAVDHFRRALAVLAQASDAAAAETASAALEAASAEIEFGADGRAAGDYQAALERAAQGPRILREEAAHGLQELVPW